MHRGISVLEPDTHGMDSLKTNRGNVICRRFALHPSNQLKATGFTEANLDQVPEGVLGSYMITKQTDILRGQSKVHNVSRDGNRLRSSRITLRKPVRSQLIIVGGLNLANGML